MAEVDWWRHPLSGSSIKQFDAVLALQFVVAESSQQVASRAERQLADLKVVGRHGPRTEQFFHVPKGNQTVLGACHEVLVRWMKGDAITPAAIMHTSEHSHRWVFQRLPVKHTDCSRRVTDKETSPGPVPREAADFRLVLNLLDHLPHSRLVKVDLLAVVARCEKVTAFRLAIRAYRRKHSLEDFLLRALSVHALLRLADVPDFERPIVAG